MVRTGQDKQESSRSIAVEDFKLTDHVLTVKLTPQDAGLVERELRKGAGLELRTTHIETLFQEATMTHGGRSRAEARMKNALPYQLKNDPSKGAVEFAIKNPTIGQLTDFLWEKGSVEALSSFLPKAQGAACSFNKFFLYVAGFAHPISHPKREELSKIADSDGKGVLYLRLSVGEDKGVYMGFYASRTPKTKESPIYLVRGWRKGDHIASEGKTAPWIWIEEKGKKLSLLPLK
jgi:hypothetical protein